MPPIEDPKLRIKVGKNLEEVRKGFGITQEALCKKLNISVTQYKKYVKGKDSVSAEALEKMAKLLGVDNYNRFFK